MKKIILSALVVMAFSFANAQATGSRFGIKGGVNFPNSSGDSHENETLIGYQVGVFSEIKTDEKFAIQPELLYSTHGVKNEFIKDGIAYNDDIKLAYLNLPILAKYFVIDGLNVQAGPQIGFLMHAEENGINITDHVKTVDFGLAFGIGYNFLEYCSVDLRYNIGLSNAVDFHIEDDSYKIKNNVFSLAFGYKLN
ncbi:porin family protein [Flavobacterium daemonense]|uniref:porin family protein n=1 Tax=Flavobacterium daemonense TaxID=1393049 RepID=UPI001186CC12|nr:porin family protein [Flavobacterium daemonense]KAF2330238.1 PorT family protein [Flavobacterium daemonense]